jgi:hypothetical protein
VRIILEPGTLKVLDPIPANSDSKSANASRDSATHQ